MEVVIKWCMQDESHQVICELDYMRVRVSGCFRSHAYNYVFICFSTFQQTNPPPFMFRPSLIYCCLLSFVSPRLSSLAMAVIRVRLVEFLGEPNSNQV